MTYVYADSTAVLGPLALAAEPGSYDLCAVHAEHTSVPKGWEVIRLPLDGRVPTTMVPQDDLMALADAVRRVGLGGAQVFAGEPVVTRRKGHLAIVADPESVAH